MQLLQSGLAPLVRSALDDRATVDAALAVLQALLVSQPEQVCPAGLMLHFDVLWQVDKDEKGASAVKNCVNKLEYNGLCS